MADFPAAAVDRLGKYNGERYNAQTNPFGLAIGGHRQNYPPSLRDTASVAAYIAAAAGEVGAAVDQTADDRRQTGEDREAARQSAAEAAKFDPVGFVKRDGSQAMTGVHRLASSTANNASFIIPAGSATPAGAALVDGAVWGDGANVIWRLGGTTRVARDSRPGSIPNANLADMPANTIKGRLSTAGAQTDLTFAALLAALGTFISGSSNGYVKIPLTDTNGLVVSLYLQWGLASGTGDVQVTFPMEFPNAVFAFTATADAQATVPNATTAYADFVRQALRSGMVVCKRSITGSGPNTHNLLSRWIAVGY